MSTSIFKSSGLSILLVLFGWSLLFAQQFSGGNYSVEKTLNTAMVSQFIVFLFITIPLMLLLLSIILHLSRPYIVRMLNQFTLRLGADWWWTGYIYFRDFSLYLSFAIGLVIIIPGFFSAFPELIRFPFIIGLAFQGFAIIIRIFKDIEKDTIFHHVTYGSLILAFLLSFYTFYDLLTQ